MQQTGRSRRPKGTKRPHPKYSKRCGKKHWDKPPPHAPMDGGCTPRPSDQALGPDSDYEGSDGYRRGASKSNAAFGEAMRAGGYHPVAIGERYRDGRYVVLQKLGWGHFSTVWLVQDVRDNRRLAMKVQKSASQYTDAARDEVQLLSEISRGDPRNEKGCCVLYDWFEHRGPHGTHICMVFETLGDNLLKLVKKYHYKGIPLPIVKNLARQMLVGLNYLHSELNIIHTDLKLENVMLTRSLQPRPPVDLTSILNNSPQHSSTSTGKLSKNQKRRMKAKLRKQASKSCSSQSTSMEHRSEHPWDNMADPLEEQKSLTEQELTEVGCKIVDFGNACWTYKRFSKDIQTRQYRCPEVILGATYGTSADMWSLACTVFELITGDFLFDPKAGDNYERDDDHLALFIELLGRIPKKVALNGEYAHQYFNRGGELRRIKNLRYCSLERAFRHRYKFDRDEAEAMAGFLLPMLEFDPDKRATAREMLNHPWLRHQSHEIGCWVDDARCSSLDMKRSDVSSDMDSIGRDSWMEENERESKCPSRVESWTCVDEDGVTRMSPTSLEGIAEMQQIFQKMSLSHDASTVSALVPQSSELYSFDEKLYKVHDSVGTVQDA